MQAKENLVEKEKRGKREVSVKNKKEGNNKGITLVALVVTIVVLLILAGITIMYVMGDNSIFKLAQDAKTNTEQAKEEEKGYLENLGNTVNNYLNGSGGTTNPPDQPEDPNPPTPEEPTVSETNSESHTETAINYTWEQINKIAQAIANATNVNSETKEVKVKIDKDEYTIGVGDTAKVRYDEADLEVRVLGFKQDDLVDTSAYGTGTTATKASISFEFMDCLGTHNMNGTDESTSTNSNGWAATEMRKWLNGYTSNEPVQTAGINGIAKTLADNMGDNKDSSGYKYIKQVKKSYIKEYNNANSIYKDNDSTKGKNYAYDYLWLLAASEIFATGYQENAHALAITTEGDQYKYYAEKNSTWNSSNNILVKKVNGSANYWWLRSPLYNYSTHFCSVTSNGIGGNYNYSYYTDGVSAGFSI